MAAQGVTIHWSLPHVETPGMLYDPGTARPWQGATRPWLALDVETSGVKRDYALQPWRVKQKKAWLTTVAFTRRNAAGELVSDGTIYPKPAYLRAILQRAIDKQMRVVTWHGTFDLAWLIAYGLGDLVDQIQWLDGMLAWKHLDITPSFATATHSYSLKGENGAIGHFAPERLGYEADIDYADQSPEGLAKLLHYNKQDTEGTLIAVEKIWHKLGSRQGAVLIEAESMPMIARANLEGMRVDRQAVVKLHAKLSETADKMAAALAPHGVTEEVIRSPKQLAGVIYDQWGLPQIDGRTTKKDTFSTLTVMDDRVALLGQFREALNLRSKFIGGIVKSCEYNEDKITRPQAKVFGTYTSRLTYQSTQSAKEPGARAGTERNVELPIGFALHQMKRAKDFRSLILAPEGYDVVEFDAAGQEFRWMAIASADQVMLNLCAPGEDPHSYMAAAINHVEYEKVRAANKAAEAWAEKMRKGGKVANLALQYRTSYKTLQIRARTDHNLKLSEHEAKSIHRTYQRTYPGVPVYWSRQIAKGRSLHYAETMAGRRVKVVGNWLGPHQWSMESTMINYPVQGTGGDQKYLAMAVMKNHLPTYNARFAWDLHDGIYWYVPKAKSMKFAIEMRKVLDHLPYEAAWDFSPPIPLPWDAKVGTSWGDLKAVED